MLGNYWGAVVRINQLRASVHDFEGLSQIQVDQDRLGMFGLHGISSSKTQSNGASLGSL